MSLSGTFYVPPASDFRIVSSANLYAGRAAVSVMSEQLLIQSDCWEDMMSLVTALHDGIAQAKQVEQEAAAGNGPS